MIDWNEPSVISVITEIAELPAGCQVSPRSELLKIFYRPTCVCPEIRIYSVSNIYQIPYILEMEYGWSK
jgi:hypothetical protein